MAEIDEEDDIEDSSNWVKANPNMGVSVQLEDMIEEWNETYPRKKDFHQKIKVLQSDEQSFVD